MREPWEFEEADLLELVEGKVQESLKWEYKASANLAKEDILVNELCKDVSAFANAAGGTIIYGMSEKNHFPAGIDKGIDATKIKREWVDQVLQHNINRPISGLRMKVVDLPSRGDNRYALVIWIPESKDAPHQSRDNKFYRRREYAADPMYEYEVREAYMRREGPDLEINVGLLPKVQELKADDEGLRIHELRASILNHSIAPAEHAFIEFLLPAENKPRIAGFERGDSEMVSFDGKPVDLQRFIRKISPNNHMPIWKGTPWILGKGSIILHIPNAPGTSVPLVWTITAPLMEARSQLLSVFINEGSWGIKMVQSNPLLIPVLTRTVD